MIELQESILFGGLHHGKVHLRREERALMLAEINNNIPVFYSAINVGANKKVEGFVMDSNGYHNLDQVKVAQ
ncbi:MAG: hypothetical protein II897_02810 [Clostridia bacterium]|nr:hypothetical protein [Clostridia bacterium]